MTLSEFSQALQEQSKLQFQLPGGESVPVHFHLTEMGLIEKTFIDCGGTLRKEAYINFQLYTAEDYDHRLAPQKLLKIIEKSSSLAVNEEMPIEVEYQTDTIGRFDLELDGGIFQLKAKYTDCLAKETCGIPEKKPKIRLKDLNANTCVPESGCC